MASIPDGTMGGFGLLVSLVLCIVFGVYATFDLGVAGISGTITLIDAAAPGTLDFVLDLTIEALSGSIDWRYDVEIWSDEGTLLSFDSIFIMLE